MKTLLTFCLTFIELVALAQVDSISQNGFVIPESMEKCIIDLDKAFSQNAKDKLKSLEEDSIPYIFDVLIIDEWLNTDSSRLVKYFSKMGLRFNYEMEYFIELAYFRYLNTGNPDISTQLTKYISYSDSIVSIARYRCDFNSRQDSLDGIYIPKDIDDCYRQLDLMLSDSLKQRIKGSGVMDMFSYHFSIGLWIRNSWGLWGCSRLSLFFRNNGVRNPDDISGTILQGYRLYLNDTVCSVKKVLKYIPPPPPPASQAKRLFVVKYQLPQPYRRHRNRFLRTGRIDDFEIGNYTSMKEYLSNKPK